MAMPSLRLICEDDPRAASAHGGSNRSTSRGGSILLRMVCLIPVETSLTGYGEKSELPWMVQPWVVVRRETRLTVRHLAIDILNER